MELNFSRTGGFAGLATQVQGKVVFSGDTAKVTSEGTAYNRKLTASEAARLSEAARRALADAASAPVGELRDAYQYDVRIRSDNGTTSALSAHGDSSDPQLEFLMSWIREECDRILDFRIHRNP